MGIVLNVVRENLRNKVLYLLALIGILIMAALILAGTVEQRSSAGGLAVRLTDSLLGTIQTGFTIVGLFGAVVAVVLSMNAIPREFERKTIHLLLIRPIERWQIALQLLLGNVLTAWALHMLLSFGLLSILVLKGASAVNLVSVVPGLITIGLNVAFAASLTTLLSAILPGAVAGFLGLGVYVAGALRGLLDLTFQMKIMTTFERGGGTTFWEVTRGAAAWVLPPVNELSGEASKFLTPGFFLDGKVYIGALVWLYVVALLTGVSLYGREV